MAKVNEISVEEKLRALYDLQIIDSRLDEIRNTRGELPIEVEDLEIEIEGLEKRAQKFETEIAEQNAEINSKKDLMKQAQTLIDKYKTQQDNVRNNKEFEALAKEVEYQELEIQLAEKRIREFGGKIDHKKETLSDLNAKIEELKNHLNHKKNELDNLISETQKEEEFLTKLSAEYAANVEDRLLAAYHRIRNNVRNGLAIVSIERGASTGSFFTIPPQTQVEIAARKKIITDEHSGRILVDNVLAAEEKQKMESIFATI